MAENPSICSICDLRHLTKPSTKWCSECDQALCDECKEYHSLSRGTQNHETIGIDDYKSLTQSVTVYSSQCSTHNDKYQMYCQTHDIPLCIFCVEEHSECKDTIPLSKKTKDIKTSDIWKDTEQNLVDIDENIYQMEAEVKKNIEEIGEQKGSILTNISRIRKEVNDHLDKLEESFLNEVKKIEDQSNYCMKDTLQMLDEKQKERLKYHQQLQVMKTHASDLQTYLGLHQISSEIVKLESSLQSVIENGSLNKVSLTCSITESLNDITRSIQTFGTIAEKKISTNITYIRQKDKQAQIVGLNPKSIHDIKMKLLYKFNMFSNQNRGCDIFPDKKMVFSDYSRNTRKNIVITDTEGKQSLTCSLFPSQAFDVACIDNNTIAVTSGLSNKGINIVDIESKTVKQRIFTGHKCHGITLCNEFLFYCVESMGIFRMNLTDFRIIQIVKCDLSEWSYVSSFNDKLYYANKFKGTITCCNMDGKTTWIFKVNNNLSYPSGLTVDNEGYIYLVSDNYESVTVLSPDGEQCRSLPSVHSELKNPSVIKFDMERNVLLITNENKTAFLFEVNR